MLDRVLYAAIWKDESFAGLSPKARLLYFVLMSVSDTKGRVDMSLGDVRKYASFGNVNSALSELAKSKRLIVYGTNKRFVCLPSIVYRQNVPNIPSVIPPPPVQNLIDFGFSEKQTRELRSKKPYKKRVSMNIEFQADMIDDKIAKKPEKKSSGTRGAFFRKKLFGEWRHVHKVRRGTVKMTAGRVKVINARINEGYEIPELIYAIRGLCFSEFHMGENEEAKIYDDLTLIFRNGENVEKFRDLYLDWCEKNEHEPVMPTGEFLDLKSE